MTGYTDVAGVETYKGQTYRLIRRDIWSPCSRGGIRRVWIWVVLSGPAAGIDGGKCGLKAEARKWARKMIKAGADGTLWGTPDGQLPTS